jgi:hypothetical protein
VEELSNETTPDISATEVNSFTHCRRILYGVACKVEVFCDLMYVRDDI